MICIGKTTDIKKRLESLIESNFPDRLSLPELVTTANEYERLFVK